MWCKILMLKIFLLIIIVSLTLITSSNPFHQYITLENISSIDTYASDQYNLSKEKIYSNNSKELSPDNPQIRKYFLKVAEVPYIPNYTSTVPKTPEQFWKDNSGDCDDKSVAFADYLYKKGVKNVKIVTIVHESKKYAHSAAMWENHIFDPTAEPPVYNMNKSEYYNFIQKQGFKLWIDAPYEPSANNQTLKFKLPIFQGSFNYINIPSYNAIKTS